MGFMAYGLLSHTPTQMTHLFVLPFLQAKLLYTQKLAQVKPTKWTWVVYEILYFSRNLERRITPRQQAQEVVGE